MLKDNWPILYRLTQLTWLDCNHMFVQCLLFAGYCTIRVALISVVPLLEKFMSVTYWLQYIMVIWSSVSVYSYKAPLLIFFPVNGWSGHRQTVYFACSSAFASWCETPPTRNVSLNWAELNKCQSTSPRQQTATWSMAMARAWLIYWKKWQVSYTLDLKLGISLLVTKKRIG